MWWVAVSVGLSMAFLLNGHPVIGILGIIGTIAYIIADS